ncbi:MAG: phosphatidate cytidylyltransferase [Promethearchaeota archaeon]
MIPYDPVTLPVSVFFVLNGFLQLRYATVLRKKFPDHNFNNSVATFLLWVFAALAYPFIYLEASPRVRWFQALSNYIICGLTPLLIFLIVYYQHRVLKRAPELRAERTIDRFLDKLGTEGDEGQKYSIRTDLKRKMLHFVPAFLIVALWVFANQVWASWWHADDYWGVSGKDFAYFLILTVGYSGIFVFAALDYVRLSYVMNDRWNVYHLLPNNVLDLLCKAMKRKELREFIKTVPLILAMIPSLFLPFGIFASVALAATIADGAASIFGKAFGKRTFPKNSPKTVAGYVAGGLTDFWLTVLLCTTFENFLPYQTLLLALTSATAFVFVDMVTPRPINLDDNILNPLLCGLVMGLVYFFMV